MRLVGNILWDHTRILCEVRGEYCVRYGVSTAWDREWIVYDIRGVYCVRSGASTLWDQASMLFDIKNLNLKATGQYFMTNLILKDIRAYFYERVIFIR